MIRRCSLRLDLLTVESKLTWQVFDRLTGKNGAIARTIPIFEVSDSRHFFNSLDNIIEKISNNINMQTCLALLRAWGSKTSKEIFPNEIINMLSLCDCGDILFMVSLDWADFPFELMYMQNRFLGQKFHIGTIINTGFSKGADNNYNQKGDLLIITDSSEKLKSVCHEGECLKSIAVKRNRQVRLVMKADNYKLNSGIPEASIVHFAGHSGPDLQHSKAGWKLGKENYFDTDDMIKLGACTMLPWLVFSNSCDGGRISVDPGLSGIAGAFLYAGVHQVVGPFCKLNDMQAKCCTIQFYKSLFKGKSAAQALTSLRNKCTQEVGLTPLFYRLFGDPRYREQIKKKIWQRVGLLLAISAILISSVAVIMNLLINKNISDSTTIAGEIENKSSAKQGGFAIDLSVGGVIHFSVNLYAPTFIYKENTKGKESGKNHSDSINVSDTLN